MIPILYAALAGTGVALIWTAPGRDRPVGRRSLDPSARRRAMARRVDLLLAQAGLEDVSVLQFVLASAAVGALSFSATAVVFGPGVPAALVGLAGSATPAMHWRRRRAVRRDAARDAWPRLIEELRVLTGPVGRSIPQALLEVGLSGPAELRPAFRAAQREWALTTDLERTVAVLKDHLGDPTADVVTETLLVAADVGGDLDQRLAALAEDRRADLAGRKEAAAKQSGARFARAFVVLVPAGMAVAGLTVGDGRTAYGTTGGQMLVLVGLAVIVLCWWWATRIMRLPEPERVFDR